MGHNMVPSILFSLGAVAAALVGAPAWCIALIAVAALAAGVVQAVFPHRSEDKLKWWTNRRTYLRHRYTERNRRRMEQNRS
ncbi:hypothetical protein [Streptomyces sp. NPDC051183]|uniref:hypothetical protein n=1 Tax=Streptomyces sp. NPDC051183 TaxID=3155165 RepID=UPI00342DE68C